MNDMAIKRMLVRICDPKHPHFPETGYLTGKTISVLGKPMTEVKINNCQHGTDGCFVGKGQIEAFRKENNASTD